MKNKKYCKKNIICLFLILVLLGGVSATYMYMNAKTNSLDNEFSAAKVDIAVIENGKMHEDSSNNIEKYIKFTKANQTVNKVVTIKNKEGDSFVRAKLIPIVRNEKDQTILYNPSIIYTFKKNTKWKTDGNYFYYSEVLKQGETTDILLESITLSEKLPNGYCLELQVLADAIASRPISNLQKAWSIKGFTSMQPLK